MRSSLRSRLLVWYSAVLLVVLSTFAALAVWSIWQSSVEDLDARLRPLATQLGNAVQVDETGRYEVNLAEASLAEFGNTVDAPYYAIWTADGTLIDRSDPFVDGTSPTTTGARVREGRREVIVRVSDGTMVLVGRSLAGAEQNVWSAATALALGGGAALVVAFLGGWLLLGRALAPIAQIAATAEAMSESNLGLRIDVSTTDELGRVATALNRAFDRLQEAFERQTRFTADASHELRTPLASQIAELEWALSRPRSDKEYEESLRVGMKAAERMRAVVEGLLTLARADADAAPLRREAIDLSALVEDTVATSRAAADARGVSLDVEGHGVVVDGDPDRLRELISNLVGNAVQYGGSGDRVVCTTSATPASVVLEVRDTGPGIDASDLPHVFERFYRANKARSRSAGGAGLGLSICKWIVESHGGRITCDSAVGQGTCFTVELPAANSATRPAV
ncbi:MAG: HAMP domain-containing protein [Acidobacteria bacterium]|nr:HAMP domain-containing protein [Acidobacteriota bacterium]